MLSCNVCKKLVDESCKKSIFCDICNSWIHFQNCSRLSVSEFDALSHNSSNWACPKCLDRTLPFFDSEHLSNCKPKPTPNSTSRINENVRSLLSDLNSIVHSMDNDADSINFHTTSCKYYECEDFNNLNLNPRSLSAFHLNIASMAKHFDEFNTLLALLRHEFSFIGITETRFIKGSPPTFNYHIEGYQCLSTPTESSAGGSLLYISDQYNFIPRTDLDDIMYQSKYLESSFAEMILPNTTNLIVGSIYRHPCMSTNSFNRDFLKPLLNKVSIEKKQILLLGDFNKNLLKLNEDAELSAFIDILGSHLILPQILLPTRITATSKTLIDNIFFSVTGQPSISGNLIHMISDHLPQFFILPDQLTNNSEKNIQYQNWSKFDEHNFILDYLDIDWGVEFNSPGPIDPNSCFDIFNSKIQKLVDRHVPTGRLTKRQIKTQQKPWITSAIIKSMSKRDFYFRKFTKAKDPDSKSEFRQLFKRYRNMIVSLCRQSKTNHYTNYFNLFSNNMHKIWEGVRSIISTKPSKSNIPTSIRVDGKLETNQIDIANSFNDFFTSIANSIRNKIPPTSKRYSDYLKNPNPDSIFLSPVTQEEIIGIIGNISPGKSSGPNSIPIKILRLLENDISKPISILINLSFESGIFPRSLKTSRVVPVYKNKGSSIDVSNYRPISLLSNIEKIYEKVMYNRIIGFLNNHDILYPKQFGFRKQHSTSQAVLTIVERIRHCLDKGELACGVFVDLQKAFDTVDHKILLSKLNHYGIRGKANDWFRSYLTGRLQYVSIGEFKSQLKAILHGVPQGSVLGPLLFLLYINDLHNCIKSSETYHFADDTHLLKFSKSLESLCRGMNADLKRLVCWLNANKISLNSSKTEFLVFRSQSRRLEFLPFLILCGKRIYPSKSVKYLGVHVDEHLSWKYHVSSVATKLQRANGMLSKIRHYVPLKSLLNIYHAIFSSHLSYACQVWGTRDTTVAHRILTLQKAALRLITFSEPRSPSLPIFAELGILKFFDLVKVLNIQFIHKFLNSNLPSDTLTSLKFDRISHSHETRCNTIGLLIEPTVNTSTFGSFSFSRISTLQWNNLQRNYPDTNLTNCKLSTIKSLATSFYMSQYIN